MSKKDDSKSDSYRVYSEALYRALGSDPFYITLQKSVNSAFDSKEAMLCYYDYSIDEASRYGIISGPGDKPFGVSVWSVPLADHLAKRKSSEKKHLIQKEMGQDCLRVYDEINAFMARAAGPLVSNQDWYLSILGVLPDHQGKGLGAELVEPILTKADAAGVATYLETFTPRNMSFYQRLGYETAGSFFEPVTQSDYSLMRRLPNPV